jgi:hypothetical protein
MSHYHFEIKSGKRGSTTEHVAYITRTGSHAKHEDLVATEHGNLPDWAKQCPELFWKASDEYERKNGSTYCEFTISLPKDLTLDQNVDLARELVLALAKSKPFLLAVHSPISSLEGALHPHAHAMISHRVPDGIERTPEETFRRYNAAHPERGGRRKDSGGMNRMQLRDNVLTQRKLAADTINIALARHGHAARVDHRNLEEQGKRRRPERYLGPARIRAMSEEEKKLFVSARHKRRPRDRPRTGKR